MADSVFFRYKHQNRFPVTYLFLEIFAKTVEISPSASVYQHLNSTLEQLGIKGPHSEDFMLGIADDMAALRDEREKRNAAASKSSMPSTPEKKKSPGSGLIKWLGDRDIESLLMLTANFDFEAAWRLYSETPAILVDKIIGDRMEMEVQRFGATFEAVVYGTGGSMKEAPDTITMSADPTAGGLSDEAKAKLKALGFM